MSLEAQKSEYGWLGLAVEATKGTDPGLDWDGDTNVGSDAMPVNRDMALPKVGPREMIDFAALTSRAPGTKQIPGANEYVLPAFSVPVFPLAISGSSSKPLQQQVMALLGFDAGTYAAGPPPTRTYQLLDHNHQACTAHRYTVDETGLASGTPAWLYKLHGLVGNGGLRFDQQTPLTLFCNEARGQDGSRAGAAALPSPVIFRDTEGDFRYPFVPWGATIATLDDEDANSYSGGVISGEVNFNHELVEKRGVDADGKPSGVIAVPGRRDGKIEIYQVPVGDWDPRTYHEGRKWLQFTVQFVSVADSNLTLRS